MTSPPASSDAAFLRQTEAALLNAPFEAGGWQRALTMLASATHSRGANFLCIGGRTPTLNLYCGYTDQEVAKTFSTPHLWGPNNWRIGTARRAFEVQADENYQAYRRTVRTDDYDDATQDIDMPFGCQTLFDRAEESFVGVAILRGRRDGPCEARTIARFRRLIQPMYQAVRAEEALAGEGVRVALGQWADIATPVMLINRHRWLCGLSAAAEPLLEEGPFGLRAGQVGLRDPRDHVRWLQLVHHLLGDDPKFAVAPARMRLVSDPAATLTAVRLNTAGSELGFGPSLSIVLERSTEHGPSRRMQQGS